MRPFVVCAAIVLSLVACRSSTGVDLNQQEELTQHERQWDHRNFHSYSFVYASQILGINPTVRITVRNDVVVSAIDVSTDQAADSRLSWPTIDGVFAVAQDGLSTEGKIVHVDYDLQYGFPAQLSLHARVANPGGGYQSTISSLQPLD